MGATFKHLIPRSAFRNFRTWDSFRRTPVSASIRRAASWAVCGGCLRNSSSMATRCGVRALGWPFQANDRTPSRPLVA